MLAIIAALAIQHEAPAELTRLANDLRQKTGAEVSPENDRGWQIWFESRKPISDAALKHVRDVKKLTAVRLLDGGFTDKGVACLRNLPDLQVLVLLCEKITDESTKAIAKLTSITKLDLNRCRLTKVGLARIATMRKLERLYLYNAKITDVDVEPLKKMKWLKLLDLPDNLSSDAVRGLRSALPNTDVE